MVTSFLGKINTECNNEGNHNRALAGYTLGEHKPAGQTQSEVSEAIDSLFDAVPLDDNNDDSSNSNPIPS